MQPKHKFTSEEAREREKAHQFGQPNGNKRGNPTMAVNQREFYRWCETIATEGDLREYVQDDSKPMARRKFVASLMRCDTIQDFFDLTNQTHGQPKQSLDIAQKPPITILPDEEIVEQDG